jgi:hypothetical protein
MTDNQNGIKRCVKRRMAADLAHGWARQFTLGNPYAKSILLALSLYVDQDGSCYPGLGTLAHDTDLSVPTVRRRLEWLERIGLIARSPRWEDEYGCYNKVGRGKRTSDEIRFLYDADPDNVETLAHG